MTSPIALPATKRDKIAILAIVPSNSDEPVYLKDLRGDESTDTESSHLFQFVLHASLDMVEEKQWQNPGLYLGTVENFRDNAVTAWISASGVKILLLHRAYPEQTVKNFLKAVHAVWVKTALNPLRDANDTIISPIFDAKIAAAALKWLGGV